MGKSTSNFAVVLTLNESEVQTLAGISMSDPLAHARVSDAAARIMREVARGGAVVQGEYASRIQEAIGTLAPATIAEHVERSVGRDGESRRVEWIVDPTQIQYYQGLADNAGITLERQLKTILDHAYEQGWLGMGGPDPHKILLTEEQYQQLQRIFAKDIVTGEDVMAKLAGAAAEAEDDYDPLLESLREAQ